MEKLFTWCKSKTSINTLSYLKSRTAFYDFENRAASLRERGRDFRKNAHIVRTYTNPGFPQLVVTTGFFGDY